MGTVLQAVPDDDGPLSRVAGRFRARGRDQGEDVRYRTLAAAAPTRFNVAGVISTSGGTGKSVITLALADLLARHAGVRTVVVDASSDFGSAGATGGVRGQARTIADFLKAAPGFFNPAELRAYVTTLPGGAHLLAGGPDDPPLTSERIADLLGSLAPWYELALVDCAPGITSELARHAITRADQLVMVTTPQLSIANAGLAALHHLPVESLTVALNHAHARGDTLGRIADAFDAAVPSRGAVAIPEDPELARLIELAEFDLDVLARTTRTSLLQLAASLSDQLL